MRETYTSFLEEGAPLPETLRVACLEYLLRGSISDYPGFVRMLTVNFGFEIYPLMARLQSTGLLSPGNKNKSWSTLIKPLQLYVEDWEAKNDQVAANYQGYVPISVRLVEKVANGEFAYAKKVMESFVDDTYCAEATSPNPQEGGDYIVVFVGGCTHSELNCLRRLSRVENSKNTYKVLTSDLFSSHSFFENLGESIPGFKTQITI